MTSHSGIRPISDGIVNSSVDYVDKSPSDIPKTSYGARNTVLSSSSIAMRTIRSPR